MNYFFSGNNLRTAISVNVLLFFTVSMISFPVFNSGDDVFFMYLLSGGFGEEPTPLLHYNLVWHPGLGWCISTLFRYLPEINWYSVFLIFFLFVSCVVFLNYLLSRFQYTTAILGYILLFLFIEARVLLHINFSIVSWHMAVAGFLLLSDKKEVSPSGTKLLLAGFFLLLASMLRIHTTLAVAILFIPFLAFLHRRISRNTLLVVLCVTILSWALNRQQVYFYKQHIPGWQAQENYRQSLFYILNHAAYNRQLTNKMNEGNDTAVLFRSGFFIDTSYINEQFRSGIQPRKPGVFLSTEGFYWLFMEMRVYLLLGAVVLFLLWYIGLLHSFISRSWFLFVLLPGAYLFLAAFFKVTFTLYLGFVLLAFIFSFMAADGLSIIKPVTHKLQFYLLLFIPAFWMIFRLVKVNNQNIEKSKEFSCMVKELEENRNRLFVATDNLLPLPFFYIWNLPRVNNISNLISTDRFFTFTWQKLLEKFDAYDLPAALVSHQSVYLVGKQPDALNSYYFKRFGIQTTFSKPDTNFKCLQARKLLCLSGCEHTGENAKQP